MGKIIKLALVLASINVNAGQLPLTAVKDSLKLADTYGQLPLSFEANRGQTDETVKFLSRGQGYTLFLTPTEAVLSLRKAEPKSESKQHQHDITNLKSKSSPRGSGFGEGNSKSNNETLALQMQLLGSNNNPAIKGVDELPGKINYLKGNDPAKWQQNVATYGKVQYQNVYPGIDLVYYGKQRQLEYDFIVQPGANPSDIRLNFKGADTVKLADNGDLVLNAKSGEVRLEKPVLYQTINGQQREVAGKFVLHNLPHPVGENRGEGKLERGQQVGFQVAAYDAAQPLVIDPVLVYSSYLGGVGTDIANDIAVDKAGNAYVTGVTTSLDFPTVNSKHPNLEGGQDAFVTKINTAGTQVLYSTYLGGDSPDESNDIAVDSDGNAYVTGRTASSNFPTKNAKYPNLWGVWDAFVTKLNATGFQVLYSTYLGGSGVDLANGIAVDNAGNATVTGITKSFDFPTVNAKYPVLHGISDAFVTKFNPTGTQVLYSTFLGGDGEDEGNDIAVDSAGNAHVTGYNKHPMAWWFKSNAFAIKFNATGSQVLYSVYFGGSSWDWGNSIAVDNAGNAYVTGGTESSDFPTINAKYPSHSGGLARISHEKGGQVL